MNNIFFICIMRLQLYIKACKCETEGKGSLQNNMKMYKYQKDINKAFESRDAEKTKNRSF